MATFRNRSGKWQARVQVKGHATLSKTFINKVDAERWAKQIEVEIQKGSYTNLVLAERTTFAEIIEQERIRAAHLKHGQETQEARAERSEKSVMFRYLTDIGNHCNMFYKQLKTRGRPPSGYAQLDLNDKEQLALTIIKTLFKQ
jgi:hypothetical protein